MSGQKELCVKPINISTILLQVQPIDYLNVFEHVCQRKNIVNICKLQGKSWEHASVGLPSPGVLDTAAEVSAVKKVRKSSRAA